MNSLTGSWTMSLCGSPVCSKEEDVVSYIFKEVLDSSTCINHLVVIGIVGLLTVALTLELLFKISKSRASMRQLVAFNSPLQLAAVVFIGCLGLLNLGLGLWMVGNSFNQDASINRPHWWLMILAQGFNLILSSFTFSIRPQFLGATFVRFWSVLLTICSAFICCFSVVYMVGEKEITFKSCLDVLLLPGALILLLYAIRHSHDEEGYEANGSALYKPLNTETDNDTAESESHVTPFAKAGFFSVMSFWWLNPLMKMGYEKPLEEKDMPLLGSTDRAQNQYLMFLEKMNSKKQLQPHAKPSVFWTIVSCHKSGIVISAFFALLKVLTLSSGPLLLKAFINVSVGKGTFKYEGIVLALTMFFCKFCESLSQRQWYFRTRTLGLQVRSFLSAAIYKKQQKLSNSAKMKHSSGEIMNYVTVDAYRIGEFPYWFHQTWTTSVQLCIALAILYNAVGLAMISSLVVIIITVLCNAPLAKLQHKFQSKLMEAQDVRLKAMSESLVHMKVLKLYAWETHFKKVIEGLREIEYKWLSAFQLRKAYNSFLFWSSPVLVSAATFLTCYLLKVPLDASNVFTFVATLRLVQDPIRQIPDVIGVVIQAKVAFTRVVKFLDAPELSGQCRKKYRAGTDYPIGLNSCSFSWDENPSKRTLRNINLAIKAGEKVAICGEVGSGKSTLLAAVLGEVPRTEGTIQVCGKIAYVSQNAWIQTGTVQDNILFGSSMDEERYKETLVRCSLEKDLAMLPHGDCTQIGERGVNLSGGQKQRVQLARALYQNADIYLLDDPFSAVDAHTASSLFNEYVMGALSDKTVLLVTHQVDFLPVFDSILLMSDGEIICSAPYQDLLAYCQEFQDLVNAHKDTIGVSDLNNMPLHREKGISTKEADDIHGNRYRESMKPSQADQLIKKEEREIGDTGLKPYMLYLRQNKGFLYASLAVISHIVFICGQISQNSWMAANVQNSSVSTLKLIVVYIAIGFGTMFFLLSRSLSIVVLGMQTSRSLFSQLLNSLFRAPMSFFDSTPLGRVLSRVSSDLSIIDLDVPFAFMFSISASLNAYSNLGVLAVVTWQVLFVSVPMIILAIKLQRYYLASAKELMRINGTTKSALANHLGESISGAITIRAFEEEDRFFAKNLELVDKNAGPYFYNFAATEWLIQRLEIMSAAVLSFCAFVMAILPPGTFSPGFVGMALSYGLSLNMSFVFSIQNQCNLANQIISVERVNQYMDIASEAAEIIEENRPVPDWPQVGKVELIDLKIKYRKDAPLVLHGITCTFEGGHKIGIVGRTGSGKTTLIGALFRLVEPSAGKIIIDSVDITTIGLHDLRSRLGIIPQDPTLFQGTVRYNLDPLGQFSDQQIWEVLDKCQLLETVQEKEHGLDSLVVEDGSNWSMGQRQLFCLGRALLRRCRILVLDEATASIDNATDAILQKTIRSEFKDCTVITVAHRIPTVMDCTMVLAMSDGKVLEYDRPMKLMETEGSLFRELVKEYWSYASSGNIEVKNMGGRGTDLPVCSTVIGHMGSLIGSWTMNLCGSQICFKNNTVSCALRRILNPSTCINHLTVIVITQLLTVTFALHLLIKISKSRASVRQLVKLNSPLQLAPVVFNGCLGLLNLGLGLWMLGNRINQETNFYASHLWLVILDQGFNLVLTSFSFSIRPRYLGAKFIRFWSVLLSIFAAFICCSSIVYMVGEKIITMKSCLDVLFLPGALLLLLYAIRQSHDELDNEVTGEDLYQPLNTQTNHGTADSERHETPFAKAGFFSVMLFWWLNPLIKMGYKKPLEEKDIPLLGSTDTAQNQYLMFLGKMNNKKQQEPHAKPSVFWTIVSCHKSDIIVSGFFALIKVAVLSLCPLLLKAFINVSLGKGAFKYEGFVLAATLFLCKCTESLAQRQWYFRTRRIGLQVRSFLSAAIYKKQQKLSNSAKLKHSSGEIINYVTVDAYRIGEFPYWFHQTWTTIVQLSIALSIMYSVVGPAMVSSLVVVIMTVLCNAPLSKLQHKFQSKLMEAQDVRLKAMSESLVHMKILKLYAWETHFRKVIEGLREVEYKWLSAFQLRKSYNSVLFWSSPVLVSAAAFLTCYLLNVPLDASSVFTFLSTVRLVQEPIRQIPDVIGVVIQAKVAFTRVAKFLDAPELSGKDRKAFNVGIQYPIEINSCSFSWDENPSKLNLKKINLVVKAGEKVAICGEVGSGKSTLLAAVLGEVPKTEGSIQICGKIAYVSQNAWIQSGTVQDNILFGSSMDEQRYQEILERCSLVKDLEMLPYGDCTQIGERGVNLSGGQKQRVQLARALYQNADIYLLDDPFSAVDAHTATSLFNEYVMGALSDKTVLLVTHQVDFLPVFDSILLMSAGEIIRSAHYQYLLAYCQEFQDLVNAHRDTIGISDHNNVGHQREKRISTKDTNDIHGNAYRESAKPSPQDQLIKTEEREIGDAGLKPYILYLNQKKGLLYAFLAIGSHLVFLSGQISQNSWLAANVENPSVNTLKLISVYVTIGLCTILFLLTRSLYVVTFGMETSRALFSQLLNSLFRAPMGFFDSTPLGRVLSRVSSDLSIVDIDIPFTFMFSIISSINAYSNLGVLAVITWQVLFITLPMMVLAIRLQRYYLASAKELMRLNGTTKSALANHLGESLSGAITIRAFEEEDRFFAKNMELVDKNAVSYFYNFSATEWLVQRLETMSAAIISFSAFVMVILPPGTFSPGFIGMALSYGLSLNMGFVFSIQSQCDLSNQIICVERVNQYMNIESEAAEVIEDNRPGPDWPQVGRVELRDLRIRYRKDAPLVLHGVNCIFEGGDKIGIVGRTGSGKSTLIGALFRLVEPAGGKIIIDSVDITTIGLHDLRLHLGIIPQDPTLFQGTVRYNLDPLGQFSDQHIWEVLDKCQLLEAVQEKEQGLDSLVVEDGSNWSMGQRQLFCLGRALLRRCRILVLDEATASIDNATDAILQKTIRTEFKDCTVITVAHRIPTVMDCSMVLAMSDGRAVEYDKPTRLMETEGSLFRDLVKEYWSYTSNGNI
uniref:ABC transporter C family member 13 n=1 Tax=Leersia perrieri TaxID=77586 RepID=A0A0D9WM62_9ORYZ